MFDKCIVYEKRDVMAALKKLSALVLIGILCVSVIGCRGSDNTEDKVTISVLAKNSWYSDVDYAQTKVIRRLSEGSDYNIDWKLRQPSSYYDIVRELILNGDELADIVQIPDLDLNMEYIDTGKFVELDKYMEYMPNFSAFLKSNPAIRSSLTTDKGHIYYVPQLVLTDNYVPCIMYNQRWLQKSGMEEPETLDELVELLRIYKNTDMNGNGKADEVPLNLAPEFLPYMFGPAFGLDLVNGFYIDDNDIVQYSYYDSDNYKEYVEFVHMLYSEGLLYSDYYSSTRETVKDQCAADCIGVTFDYSWHMSMLYSAQYDSYDGETPVFKGAKPLSGTSTGYYIGRNAISGFFGVTYSDNIIDAVKLLDYMISDENELSYCFGILNESYVVNSDGTMSFTEKAQDDTYVQQLGINPICVPSRQSVDATDALLPKWHARLDKELAEYVKKPYPFIFSTTYEASKNNGYSNYIAKYVEQQTNAFIMGKQSINDIDNFNEALKNMGIEDIIKQKQIQYNRYKGFLEQ